jgi:uncharacterized protein YcfJ
MTLLAKLAIAVPTLVLGTHALADATFYSRDGFRGEAMTIDKRSANLERQDFNDRASSVRIDGEPWEVCEQVRFEGRCVVLRRGSYASLRDMGLDNAISSARPLERGQASRDRHAGPAPVMPPPRGWHGPQHAVLEVPVTSARPIATAPEQRCWLEREQVSEPNNNGRIAGAVIGGVVGGLLGNQVGKVGGKDVATVGGAVAGAALGAHLGKGTASVSERDVQKCEMVDSGKPAGWDVTYVHAGVERRAQLPTHPGRTIRVDGRGQPLL